MTQNIADVSPIARPDWHWVYRVTKRDHAWGITAHHLGAQQDWRTWFASSHTAVLEIANQLAAGTLRPDCGIQWHPAHHGIPPRIAAKIAGLDLDKLARIDDREWSHS